MTATKDATKMPAKATAKKPKAKATPKKSKLDALTASVDETLAVLADKPRNFRVAGIVNRTMLGGWGANLVRIIRVARELQGELWEFIDAKPEDDADHTAARSEARQLNSELDRFFAAGLEIRLLDKLPLTPEEAERMLAD